MSDYKPGVYEWVCGADIYPIPFPSDIPDECGARGVVEFDPEDGSDEPSIECTKCGTSLSAACDPFIRVGDLPSPVSELLSHAEALAEIKRLHEVIDGFFCSSCHEDEDGYAERCAYCGCEF